MLPVFVEIQADADLRAEFGDRMAAQGLGPHRGVVALANWLTEEQHHGHVDPDSDPQAAAMMVMGAAFLRVFTARMLGKKSRLPGRTQTVDGFTQLLAPPK